MSSLTLRLKSLWFQKNHYLIFFRPDCTLILILYYYTWHFLFICFVVVCLLCSFFCFIFVNIIACLFNIPSGGRMDKENWKTKSNTNKVNISVTLLLCKLINLWDFDHNIKTNSNTCIFERKIYIFYFNFHIFFILMCILMHSFDKSPFWLKSTDWTQFVILILFVYYHRLLLYSIFLFINISK